MPRPHRPSLLAPKSSTRRSPSRCSWRAVFHNTVYFFDQVARLPRIVNIEDIAMADAKDVRGRGWVIKTPAP